MLIIFIISFTSNFDHVIMFNRILVEYVLVLKLK